MTAGRPRQPTNVLALKGAFDKDPARGRAREDEPDLIAEIGDPPDHLNERARYAWVELTMYAHPGTLCSSDRPFMEYAAKIWAEVKASTYVDPKIGVRFESIIARLGMSPADRSRVSVIKKPNAKRDPYSEF